MEVGIAFAVCSFPLMLDKIVQGESLKIAGIQKIHFSELLGLLEFPQHLLLTRGENIVGANVLTCQDNGTIITSF